MLPIGGHLHHGAEGSSAGGEILAPQVVLPLHFGTFPPLTGTPQQLAAVVDSSVQWWIGTPGKKLGLS